MKKNEAISILATSIRPREPKDRARYDEAVKMAVNALKEPERKGKWTRPTRVEPVYSIDGVETWGIKCQCNQCDFATTVVEDFGYYSYCPNCGADMRGERR